MWDEDVGMDAKRSVVKKLFERTNSFAHLIGAVSLKGDALQRLSRGPKGGCVQDLIFWDEFLQHLGRIMKLQTEVSA